MKPADNQLQKMEPQAVDIRPPVPAVNSMMEVIARAAADPNTDVSKMERLYAMLKEENARIAENQFNEAMATAQAEMPMILKRSTNPSTNSKYAKLEAMAKAIMPVIEKHKFSLKFSEGDSPNPAKIRVMCKVSMGGHSEEYHVDLSPDDKGMKGNDSKTKIHGEGSTFSYGRRYLTAMIFNLTIIGEDDDGNQGHRPRPASPSTLAPKDLSVKELASRLWNLLKPVVSQDPNWKKTDWIGHNNWLWKFDVLDAAANESAPDLTPARFEKAIADATAKLKEIET